jgi:hypothetical protein
MGAGMGQCSLQDVVSAAQANEKIISGATAVMMNRRMFFMLVSAETILRTILLDGEFHA